MSNQTNTQETHNLIDYPALCNLLGITMNTARAWVCRKKIPYYKCGGKLVRFSRKEIMSWLESQKHEPEVRGNE